MCTRIPVHNFLPCTGVKQVGASRCKDFFNVFASRACYAYGKRYVFQFLQNHWQAPRCNASRCIQSTAHALSHCFHFHSLPKLRSNTKDREGQHAGHPRIATKALSRHMERHNQRRTNVGLRQFLAHTVPVVVGIVMTHPKALRGKACYPVIQGELNAISYKTRRIIRDDNKS